MLKTRVHEEVSSESETSNVSQLILFFFVSNWQISLEEEVIELFNFFF